MRRETLISVLLRGSIVVLVAGAIVGARVVWNRLFGEVVAGSFQSVSPDGTFRCTLTECGGWKDGGLRRYARVAIEKRINESEELWEDVRRDDVSPVDDSAPGVYYITWACDRQDRTTGVNITGDYGSPECGRKSIFGMRFLQKQ